MRSNRGFTQDRKCVGKCDEFQDLGFIFKVELITFAGRFVVCYEKEDIQE